MLLCCCSGARWRGPVWRGLLECSSRGRGHALSAAALCRATDPAPRPTACTVGGSFTSCALHRAWHDCCRQQTATHCCRDSPSRPSKLPCSDRAAAARARPERYRSAIPQQATQTKGSVHSTLLQIFKQRRRVLERQRHVLPHKRVYPRDDARERREAPVQVTCYHVALCGVDC